MILSKFEETINKHKLIKKNDSVLIAVSGGADSMCLLHLFLQIKQKYNLKIYVAHLNHLLRGKASMLDEKFVRDFCKKNEIEFFSRRIKIKALAKQKKMSLETTARQVRYDFFSELALSLKINKVAVAHHLDDQAETILMRLIFGTGPDGISGMHFETNFRGMHIIRPLLDFSKTELVEYLKENKVLYRTDATNFNTDILRNSIRHNLIPYVEKKYTKDFKKNLCRFAELVKLEGECTENLLAKEFRIILTRVDDRSVSFGLEKFLKLEDYLRNKFLRYAVKTLKNQMPRWDYKHIDILKNFCCVGKNGKLHLPGVVAECINSRVTLVSSRPNAVVEVTPSSNKTSTKLLIPGITKIEGKSVMLSSLVSQEDFKISKSSDNTEAFFDYEKLELPLYLRKREPSDKIQIFGKIYCNKKIQDLFIDEKIPAAKREKINLLVNSKNDILWVAGVRRSNISVIGKHTKKILRLKCLTK